MTECFNADCPTLSFAAARQIYRAWVPVLLKKKKPQSFYLNLKIKEAGHKASQVSTQGPFRGLQEGRTNLHLRDNDGQGPATVTPARGNAVLTMEARRVNTLTAPSHGDRASRNR